MRQTAFMFFKATKVYKSKPNRDFEIRHNIRVQSAHDERVFVSPDYAVVEPESVEFTHVKHYYNFKADYFYTFAETKHYNPGPEMILNFVGLVNEIMPNLIDGNPPNNLPKHFGPALFISGVGNSHTKDPRDMSDSEEHEKDYALLLEVYKQRNEWARAYMNLRLRHFAAFAIVMVFVATAAFKLDNLTAYRSPILIFGIIITLLFWLLDYRTGEFLKAHISEYKQIESSFLNLEAGTRQGS